MPAEMWSPHSHMLWIRCNPPPAGMFRLFCLPVFLLQSTQTVNDQHLFKAKTFLIRTDGVLFPPQNEFAVWLRGSSLQAPARVCSDVRVYTHICYCSHRFPDL